MIGQIGARTERVAVSEARVDLARRYNQQVLRECRDLVEGRYPVNRDSPVDVPLADFTRVFGPNGVVRHVLPRNLAPLVDTSTTPWRWRQGAAPIGGSSSLLRQFQAVQRIRDVFFGRGQSPEARFFLAPEFMDAAVIRFSLEVDGQTFEYRHGPQQSRPMAWPGASGQASFVFEVSAVRFRVSPKQVPGPGSGCWSRLASSARAMPLSRDFHGRREIDAAGARRGVGAQSVRPQRIFRLQLRDVNRWKRAPRRILRQAALSWRFPAAPGPCEFVAAWDAWLQQCLTRSRSIGDAGLKLISPGHLAFRACRGHLWHGCVRRRDGAERRSRRALFPDDDRHAMGGLRVAIDVACGACVVRRHRGGAAEASSSRPRRVRCESRTAGFHAIQRWMRRRCCGSVRPRRISTQSAQWHVPLASVHSLQRAVNALAAREIEDP